MSLYPTNAGFISPHRLGLWLFACTTLLFFSLLVHADDQDGKPDLYEIRDKNSSIFLFGTVHLLPPGTDWLKPIVQQKLATSTDTYFELDMDQPGMELKIAQAFNQRLLDPNNARLANDLTADRLAELTQILAPVGLTAELVDRMAPWAAAVLLGQVAISKAGFDAQSGVEAVLLQETNRLGKDAKGLETIDDQLNALSGASRAEQVVFLEQSLEDYAAAEADLRTLITAWLADDVDTLTKLSAHGLPTDKGIGKMLLTDRNLAWMKTLENALAQDVTSFAAVGALHLHGETGLLKLFTDRGYEIVRH